MTCTYQKRRKLFVCFIFSMIFVLIFPSIVFAGDSETINIIETYKQAHILQNAGFLKYFFVWLGWGCCVGLYYLVLGLEGVVFSINKVLGGFFTAPEFVDFLDKFKPLMIGLLAISVCILGFRFMFKPKMDKSKVATNIVLSVLVIVGLPACMTELYKLTNVAIESINMSTLSIADEVLFENITDVSLYDSIEMPVPVPKLDRKINISKSKIVNINPTETIDAKMMNVKDVWKNTTKYNNSGQAELIKNKSEKFGLEFTSTMFYRYKINFFSIIITLLISSLALVLSGLKIARLLYELAINQSIAFFSAVTDIAGGQRLKKAIEMIIGTFVILFSCFYLLQLYVIGSAYCNANIDNVIVRLISLGALAWAVIDGPNLVERIVGIDAGINSAFKAITGTYMAGKTLSAINKGIGGFAKNATAKAISGGANVGGMVAGVAGAARETWKKNNTSNSSPVTSTGLVPTSNTNNSVSQAVSKKSSAQMDPIRLENSDTKRIGSNTASSPYSQTGEKRSTNTTSSPRPPADDIRSANTTSSTHSPAEKNINNIDKADQNEVAKTAKQPLISDTQNEYEGRTWRSEKSAQIKQSNTANTYRRAYNLTKNGVVQSYEKRNAQKAPSIIDLNNQKK